MVAVETVVEAGFWRVEGLILCPKKLLLLGPPSKTPSPAPQALNPKPYTLNPEP